MKNLRVLYLSVLTSFLLGNFIQAQSWFGSGISGEGGKVTETLNLSSFDAFSLNIDADVYLTQGSSQSIKIEAQKNILDNIKRDVEGGYWKIKYDKDVKRHDGVKIWITIPDLEKVAVSGSGNVIGQTPFSNLNDLKLAISGSGDIRLDANSKSLSASVSGSGDFELNGRTGDAEFNISGSGDIEAGGLQAENCKVNIAGSGDASVYVNSNLDVGIAGSGDVVYSGNPRVKSKIAGSGDVKAK